MTKELQVERRESNYEIMKHQMQAQFATYDLDVIASQWSLEEEDGHLQACFVKRDYLIDVQSGQVLFWRGGALVEADYNVSMTLFDMLTRPRALATNEFMPLSSFSPLYGASSPSGRMFDQVAKRLDHHGAELAAACEHLGGMPYGKGDVGYKLPVFKDLNIVLQFWDSDEEFGPQITLFCDRAILDFMYYETMMFMLLHVLERIEERMSAGTE